MALAPDQRSAAAAVDVVVALALAAASLVEVWAPRFAPGMGEVDGDRWLLTMTCLTMTLPLTVRRQRATGVLLVALASAVLQVLATTPTEGLSTLVALLLAAYSSAAYPPRRQALVNGAVIGVASWFTTTDPGDGFFVLILLGTAWAMGLAVGRDRQALRSTTAERDLLVAEQAEAAARGAAEERVRIARDLHDVVAHRVSLMVVQAQAADAQLAGDPVKARRSLAAVEDAGRAALAELRTLLGVLRSEESGLSRPDLTAIEELVASSRASGMQVELQNTGSGDTEVSATAAMAAYRVVQEALTNVVKHAGNAPVRVTVDRSDDRLVVEVYDDGPATAPAGPGFGLSGMTERVLFAGGRLDYGPAEHRGFRVRAELPTTRGPS